MMLAMPFLSSPPDSSLAAAAAPREERQLDVTSESEPKEATTSYGGSVALAYVIPISVTITSVGLFLATRDDDRTAGGFVFGAGLGLMGGVVAPPVVHLFHDNFGSGVASFGGSLLSTAAGGFVGLAVTANAWDDEEDDGDDDVSTAIVGFSAGAAVFQGLWGVIDSNELAKERHPTKDPERTALRPTAAVLAVPMENGALFGIRGTF